MAARAFLGAAFLVLGLTACGGASESVWFREAAVERGLVWNHVRAHTPRFWFPEIMGGGVGLLDVDGDGHLDVFLVQSGDLSEPRAEDQDRLFRNLGGGRFEDVSTVAVPPESNYGMGIACADADEDGDPDVYVTNYGPNALLLNEGGVLRDATAASGTGDPGWGTSAAWSDLDRDGDLDLFVTNYLRWSREQEILCRSPQGGQDYCSPLNYDAPARDVLFRNLGSGRFEDVSERAGLGTAFGNGLGVVAADLDDDGWCDVYVANDMMPNQLWQNRGDFTFVDRALLAGCAVNRDGASEAGMGVQAFDAEGDGDLDLFVTHLRDETNTLYANESGLFSDQTSALGLGVASLPFTGFGVLAEDFDRDGRLDLYVANGAVTRSRTPFDPADPYAEPNQVFRGGVGAGGRVRFEELLPRGGAAHPTLGNSRGVAAGDLDEDGDLDVVVVENGGALKLLRNQATGGPWIGLEARERSGRAAEGAELLLEWEGGRLERRVTQGGSYCSSSDPRVLTGLGDASGPVAVTVRWADGTREAFGPLAVGRKYVLPRGAGRAP